MRLLDELFGIVTPAPISTPAVESAGPPSEEAPQVQADAAPLLESEVEVEVEAEVAPEAPPAVVLANPESLLERLLAEVDAEEFQFRPTGMVQIPGGGERQETDVEVIQEELAKADQAIKNALDPILKALLERRFSRLQRMYNHKFYVK